MNYKKRDKVFEFLDNQDLMRILVDFSIMPEEIMVQLQASCPDYPNYPQYKQITMNKHFNSFDEFAQDINNYIRTIPELFPNSNYPNGDPPINIKVAKCTCEEILILLNRYIKLLKLDKNTLKGRYFKYITEEYTDCVFKKRPDRYETELLIEKYKTKVFTSHSIPLKINPE